MPIDCLEAPYLVVRVLSPNSGPSSADGQPGAAECCRFLLQPDGPNNCSAPAQHLGGTREALNSSTLGVWVSRGLIPLCLMHGEHFSALHISLNPKSQQRKRTRCGADGEILVPQHSSSSTESPWQPLAAAGGLWASHPSCGTAVGGCSAGEKCCDTEGTAMLLLGTCIPCAPAGSLAQECLPK